jgi:hypothetical protein
MHKLAKLIAEKISSGLQRKAITDAGKWAEIYRVMGAPFPGRWKWDNHPWLYEPHKCQSSVQVVQKAAQLGFSELALNRTFHSIDILGLSVLYVLPTEGDASDFSSTRFNVALENSDYLSTLFDSVKNVGLKRSGNSSLYLRGSKSRSKLKSIPTAVIVFDEVDEMVQENITLAIERQSGQREGTQGQLYISTPTIPEFGINKYFKESTQEIYFFKCPHCSKLIWFKYPDCVVVTADDITDPKVKNSHYICIECGHKLDHETKKDYLKPLALGGTGRYVPTYTNRDIVGYSCSQLYAIGTVITPEEIAKKVILSRTSPADLQELYNSKLGETCVVPGAKITDEEIETCISDYYSGNNNAKRSIRTMGIDVGTVFHWVIEEWYFEDDVEAMSINDRAVPKCLAIGSTNGGCNDVKELDDLMREYNIDQAVIDGEPERRIALQFANRWWGKVYLSDFISSCKGRQLQYGLEEEALIKINRTSWLDLSFSRFKSKRIFLPVDTPSEYKRHIKEPQRIYKKDRDGNPTGVYESVSADHFAFARLYSELAIAVAQIQTQNTDVKGVL